MGRSKVISVKRVGGAPDLPSRAKVFGPDANINPLVCCICQFGDEEDWVPMMKNSECPTCGNREEHKPKRRRIKK